MAKLTDTQLIVLSKAAGRDDGAASVPDGLNKAAASKLGVSLNSRKLMRQVRSKSGCRSGMRMRRAGTGLVITRDGRVAIGIDEEANEGLQESTAAKGDSVGREVRRRTQQKRPARINEPRPGSKQAIREAEATAAKRMIERTMDRFTRICCSDPSRASLTGR